MNMGLDKDECANGKRNASFYIKLNQKWSNKDFENCTPSLVYHMFDDHSLCHDLCCSKLQADKIDDPAEQLKKDKPKKYRDPTLSSAATKEYQKVKDKVLPLLTPEKMKAIHPTFSTQKNEALQKQMTVYCPKDQFFGGSVQLNDRIRYLVIEDSLGMGRLFHHMGLAPLRSIMSQWAGTRDNSNKYIQNYRQKLEVRQKRAAAAIAKMKEGMLKDMKAEKAGETSKTGVANEQSTGEEQSTDEQAPPKKKQKPRPQPAAPAKAKAAESSHEGPCPSEETD